MRVVIALRALLVLVVLATIVCASAVRAQYREPKPCMPFGSFADELRARGIGVPEPTPPPPKIQIAKVGFHGVTQLSDSELKKLAASLKRKEFEDDDRFIATLEDSEVRAFWQDRGYFRVHAKVTAQVYGDPAERKVAVGITVEEGLRYRLREIRFENTDGSPLQFLEEQLRKQIPLRDGEVFAVDRIRIGLDNLKKLYGEAGYIDFTSEPRTEAHDTTEISLLLRLTSEKQFRIGRITVLGLPPEKQVRLKWRLKEGDVFNNRAFEAFFSDNKDLLPPDADRSSVEVLRDLKEGFVTLTYNFSRCPPYPPALP